MTLSSVSMDYISPANKNKKDPELKVRIVIELIEKVSYGENIVRTFRRDVRVPSDSSFRYFENEVKAIARVFEEGRARL